MRLKASFTLENSVIIPLFTLIIVGLILFTLDLHDLVVVKNGMFQAAVVIEKSHQDCTSQDTLSKYTKKTTQYLKDKVLRMKNITIQSEWEGNSLTVEQSGFVSKIPFLREQGYFVKKISTEKCKCMDVIRAARAFKKISQDIKNE